jgi:diacylglycerol kinase family enzyme
MQDQLTAAFADLNAQMLARQLEWAYKRHAAVTALIAELAPKRRKMGEWAYYDAVFAAAGGKTWFNLLTSGGILKNVTKNVEATIANRDAKIIKALTKAGVTSIAPFELTHTSDGYEGQFDVDGHRVTIKTILAGGYNIQCLHQRTTVKVRA